MRWIRRDHVVYANAKAGEIEKLIVGSKTMIIRGAAGSNHNL